MVRIDPYILAARLYHSKTRIGITKKNWARARPRKLERNWTGWLDGVLRAELVSVYDAKQSRKRYQLGMRGASNRTGSCGETGCEQVAW